MFKRRVADTSLTKGAFGLLAFWVVGSLISIALSVGTIVLIVWLVVKLLQSMGVLPVT